MRSAPDPPSNAARVETLVIAAQAGDRGAMEALIAHSHPHLKRMAYSLCATPQEAEEATQEALLVLYRRLGSLRAAAALSSWLFRIVRNECLRQARLVFAPELRSAEVAPSAEAVMLARLESKRIIEAIASLPEDQRAVLLLRDVQGYSGTVTAQSLEISKAAMKSRLHRARATVRGRLADSAAPDYDESGAAEP